MDSGVCWEMDREGSSYQDSGVCLFCFAQSQQPFPFSGNKKVSTLSLQLSLSTKVKRFVSSLHLSSLVVLTSSATLLMELMKVLRSELWTSQRTKYSSSAVPSRGFRLSLVSRWWILASNVFWNMEKENKNIKQHLKHLLVLSKDVHMDTFGRDSPLSFSSSLFSLTGINTLIH